MQAELARAQATLSKKHPNPDKAIKLLRPLLKRGHKSWMIYHYMGVAMLQKANYAKALEYLLKALDVGGSEPETFHLVSVAYHNLNEFELAIKYGNEAIRKKRDFLEAWINLGAAHRAMANLDEAMQAYSEANRIDPKNAGIAYRIGSIYLDQGDLKKAEELYEITAKMDPNFIEAYLGQSVIKLKIQKYADAVDMINKALEIDPNNRLSRIQLGVAYKDWGRYTEAIKINEQLLRESPKDGRLRVNYALCLLEVGRFNEAERNYLKALKDSPDAPESLSNYLMGIHYNPERTKDEIFDAHLLWDEYFAPKQRNKRPIPKNIDPNKKLRIGFISGGFRKHPVGWMITRAIENLPKDQFEIYGYNTHAMYDSLTLRIRNSCDKWKSVLGYTDKIVAKILKEDEIDILVELSGHSAFNRLKTVSLEPVPITIKWVGGLFNTTGIQSMDYLLTDKYESPVGEELYYTEKLVRMPDDYVVYEPPEYGVEVGELPALYNGHITFGCFNNPSKLNDQLIEQWSEILHLVPDSKLFLKSKQYDTLEFVDQVTGLFEDCGISKDRIIFEGYAMHEDLLATYNQIDIALDPWPYSGGLTTCEALWMGVPVVTCAGPTFAGRHSVTHLANSGNAEWVTHSWKDYKSKVIELASDLDQLKKIRSGLRKRLLESPLCDGARYSAHLSIAFREMWKQRVAGYEQNLAEGEWQDHIDVRELTEIELNEFYETHNISKEASHLNDYESFEVNEKLKLALPKSKENYTHFRLIEKGDENQTLVKVLDQVINENDTVIEVGAGYGTLTLQLANLVSKEGKILSLEPNPATTKNLKESRRLNNAYHIQLIEAAAYNENGASYLRTGDIEEQSYLDAEKGAIPVKTKTLDSILNAENVESVKLLILDVFDGISEIISGSNVLLNQIKPVLCLGNHEELNQDDLQAIDTLGYKLFEHIEEVGVLSAIELSQKSTSRWIFALTEEWVEKLNESGFVFNNSQKIPDASYNYLESIQDKSWVSQFKNEWISEPEGAAEESYFNALDILWEVDQNSNLSPAEKGYLSVEAATSLLDLYTANPGNIPVACSLTRAFLNIGKPKDAASVLKNAFEQIMTSNSGIDLSLPFLLPLKEQENSSISSDRINWLKVKVGEAWILLQKESTYFLDAKELKFLKRLNGNPEALPIIRTISEELLANGEIAQTEAPSRKEGGKFIHICFNHVYTKAIHDLLEYANEHSEQEHEMYLEKHTAIENFFLDIDSPIITENFDYQHDLDRIKKLCMSPDVDGVFFHGIFLDWQKKLLKHIGHRKHVAWVMWGGDLYNPIKFKRPARFLNGFIDSIYSLVDGDFKLFKDHYGDRDCYTIGYPYPGLYGDFNYESETNKQPLIIVGNSGDKGNNHLDVLQILATKKDIKDYQILLPVSYNLDDDYEEILIQSIKNLGLENNTKLEKEFIRPEVYMQMVISSFMFIGAHDRQQALGNILGSIYGGNHTIIKETILVNDEERENPSWPMLQEHGFQVQDLSVLEKVQALHEITAVSVEQRIHQQNVIRSSFGLEKRAGQLVDSCNQILEKNRSKQPIFEQSV